MRSSTFTLSALALVAQSLAAYVPSEPWSTLTPTASIDGAYTHYTSTFAISIEPITSAAASVAKRDVVTQIGDGQIQATTATTAPVVSQIGDGQIQATTATTAPVVSQIGDGQIQATTATTAPVVSQIGDGQIQATTATTAPVVSQIGDGQIQATTATTAPVVSQIGDGQIQATTATENVVTQIGDGQIQASTATEGVVTQIGDGQIQASTATDDVVTQITDGQIQASGSVTLSTSTKSAKPTTTSPLDSYGFPESCKSPNALSMTLEDGLLFDGHGRVGSIVANRQFQFDGPPPQAGAIYAAGWSITRDGNLAIGDEQIFYQCLSGNFYNLYDESIGSQCLPVHLKIVDLVDC